MSEQNTTVNDSSIPGWFDSKVFVNCLQDHDSCQGHWVGTSYNGVVISSCVLHRNLAVDSSTQLSLMNELMRGDTNNVGYEDVIELISTLKAFVSTMQ